MGCFQADKPGKLDYGQILRDTLTTQADLQPLLLSSEAQYGPAQTNLTLQNMNQLLFGSPGGQFDVQTFTPPVFQESKKISYGKTPKDFKGEVQTPALPKWGTLPDGSHGWIYPSTAGTGTGAAGMTFDAATGQPITPRKPGDGSSGIGLTGSTTGDAAALGAILGPMGAAAGAGIGSAIETGNPDPISAAMGLTFWGDDGKIKLADSRTGTRTVTQGAQPGLIQLLNQVNSATRAAGVNDISQLGPEAISALLASNPEAGALINELNRQAMDELSAGSSLTPEEERIMQQQARASWAARGLGGSDPAAAEEILRMFALGQNLKGQRQAFAGNVLGLNQSYLQNPMLQLLSTNGGSSASGQAQGLLNGNLFNPESPFAGNIANANKQMAALFADPSTLSKINQTTSTVGNVLGTVGQIASMAGGI